MKRSLLAACLLASLAAGASTPARGASFDCAAAHTRIETMICADPTLSRLDEEVAKDFHASTGVFDTASPGSEAVTADLQASQKAWFATRDACADAACVASASQARIAVLEFHGRPGKAGWADRLAGTYKHADFMTLGVQVRDENSVRVAISGADPQSARWTCDFTGIGQRSADGGVTVTTPGGSAAALTLMPNAAGMEVRDTQANRVASKAACGLDGTLVWGYRRR